MMVIIRLTMMVVGAGLAMADDNAATAKSFTCSGGTATSPTIIPAGTYTHVTVTGICRILGAVTGPTIGSGGAKVIKGGVTATQPLTLIFHSNTISGGLSVHGGGGGVNCDTNPNLSAALDGSSATYTDFENNAISGGLSISGLQSCWFGIFRNQVDGSASVTNNTFADPDATEVATNVVDGNLTCLGNSPAAQIGDSGGSPNIVTGRKLGEWAKL
jgi:hypothetical protein